jgi:hypothetical protein
MNSGEISSLADPDSGGWSTRQQDTFDIILPKWYRHVL